jgi:tRNA (guanine-N7-)-methyltransferase
MTQLPKFLPSFGRNRGRSLRPHQQSLVDGLLPKLAVDLTSPLREVGAPSDLSQGRGYSAVALEIGFGGGEHLLAQAAHNPDTLFIGCEPFINGVAKCLAGIEAQKLNNIRLFTNDARKLVEALPDACLDSVFILFPDPWPKVRHNKRRLVNPQTLSMIARAHKKGGRLLLATDHVDYSVWMLEVLLNHPDYEWAAQSQADWKTPPADWTETKYQRKTTSQGRDPLFFECVRR